MKLAKLLVIIILLAILSVPGFFIYTRFLIAQYAMQGDTLTLNNAVYVRQEPFELVDEQSLGNTIGIAIDGPRTITDYIWPNWVIEYKNDPQHARIFVRGLMDLGQPYYRKQ